MTSRPNRCCSPTAVLSSLMLLMLVVVAAPALPAMAHETDQFTVPAGREFADIGDELTKTAYTAIDKGVNKINARIKSELDSKRSVADLNTPDAIASVVNSQFAPAMFLINDYDKRVISPAAKKDYPGKIVGFKPSSSVRKYVNVPLSPFNAWECATIQVYGITMGTDKIGHFTDMGMHYFRAYRKAIKEGVNQDDALTKAIRPGTKDFVTSEAGLLGRATAGAYSNGDLVANMMGMYFYRNLSEPVMLKGAVRPPMLVVENGYWKITPRVRPDSQFFSLFISEHFDEALNPSDYNENMRKGIRRAIEEHADDVVQRYADPNGNRRGQLYFENKVAELSTYWGVDYGHQGGLDELLTISGVCYGGLDANAPLDKRDRVGRTLLHIAAERGETARVEELIQRGADVNAQVRSNEDHSSDWGNTPLHVAARDGQLETVKLLLDRGANINARNDRGVTPLHRAIGTAQVAELLVQRGAELDAPDGQGRTPLHWAANDPSSQAIDVLIKARANVNAKDIDGATPLHRAARAANVPGMQSLIDGGAQVNSTDRNGATPLHMAALSDDPIVASVLVRNGAQVDVRDSFGCTALHDATLTRADEVVALLIGAGAKTDIANDYGVTPLQLAERTGRNAIAGLLKGANQSTSVAAAETVAKHKEAPSK